MQNLIGQVDLSQVFKMFHLFKFYIKKNHNVIMNYQWWTIRRENQKMMANNVLQKINLLQKLHRSDQFLTANVILEVNIWEQSSKTGKTNDFW